MKKEKNNLGNRIKSYELVSNHKLTQRLPVILRVDGKAFHTYTQKTGCKKPFDESLIECMVTAGEQTSREMMGFVLGYHQSDEVTFYINNTQNLNSQAWFNNELQKIISITASLFTANFNFISGLFPKAVFDCRAFSVPPDDVPNVFIWRQRDWERNSLQMLARNYFSHKECQGKNNSDLHDMLHSIGINWNDLNPTLKNGTFFTAKERINRKMDYNGILELI